MSHSHRTVENRRLYEQVADQIKALIEAEGLTGGTRLPAERDLAARLGVSRPSIREALIALDIEGRIEIRSGSGVYISSSSRRGPVCLPSLGESPGELMQARVVLESSVATLAAARASRPGLERIEEALEDMRNELAKGHRPVDADRRFHLSIAEQGGNSVLVGMVGTLFDGRHSPLFSRMSGRVETVHSWRAALAEHAAIVRALKSRNPQAAAAAMSHHLHATHDRWIGEPSEMPAVGALA